MFKKALASALIAISLSMAAFSSHAAIREGRVVFDDGTSQTTYPAVLYPETFINLLSNYSGVQNVIYNVDGSFSLSFQGQSISLLPTYGTTTTSTYNYVAPSISTFDGSLIYKVYDSGNHLLLTHTLIISYN